MPYIHPQHNATSSACAAGHRPLPDAFLYILSQISVSRAWFPFIHVVRNPPRCESS